MAAAARRRGVREAAGGARVTVEQEARARWAAQLAPVLAGRVHPCAGRCGADVIDPENGGRRKWCDDCRRKRQREYGEQYRAEHPELRAKAVEDTRRWRAANPDLMAAQYDRRSQRRSPESFDEHGRRVCVDCRALLERRGPGVKWPKRCPECRRRRRLEGDRARRKGTTRA